MGRAFKLAPIGNEEIHKSIGFFTKMFYLYLWSFFLFWWTKLELTIALIYQTATWMFAKLCLSVLVSVFLSHHKLIGLLENCISVGNRKAASSVGLNNLMSFCFRPQLSLQSISEIIISNLKSYFGCASVVFQENLCKSYAVDISGDVLFVKQANILIYKSVNHS